MKECECGLSLSYFAFLPFRLHAQGLVATNRDLAAPKLNRFPNPLPVISGEKG